MTKAELEQVQSKIVAAFRKVVPVDLEPGLGEMWIKSGIGTIMAYVEAIHSDKDVNWRRPLGRNKVQKELDEISDLYRKLALKMDLVHQPTLEILSMIGIGPLFERTRCENFIDRLKLIDTSDLPSNVGRGQSKMRERSLADRLAITYANVTGDPPARSYDWINSRAYGRFLHLVEEVFEIAQIDASAEDCARHAVESYGRRAGEKGD